MKYFLRCIPNICIFDKKTDNENKMKQLQEIRKKRMSMLPFAHKTNKVMCNTHNTLSANKITTEEISKKSAQLYDSVKKYQEMAKNIS